MLEAETPDNLSSSNTGQSAVLPRTCYKQPLCQLSSDQITLGVLFCLPSLLNLYLGTYFWNVFKPLAFAKLNDRKTP